MDAYFLSDIHLHSVEERNGQTLLRFLTSVADGADKNTALFLLGDIFDLWVADHEVFRNRFSPLIGALETLRRRGGRIVYFEGNHDMHLEKFWGSVLGAEILVQAAEFEIDGLRLRCEHGDEINLEDKSYLRLRAVLRSAPLKFLGHALPGGFWDWLGQRWSRTSRKYSSVERESQQETLREMIRHHAARAYREHPYDVLISGHLHVLFDEEIKVEGNTVRAINLGSWLDRPRVLRCSEGRLDWIDLSPV